MRGITSAVVAILVVTIACSTASNGGRSGSCPPCELFGTDNLCVSCDSGHPTSASATDLHGCSTAVAGVVCCPGACTAHTRDVTDFIAAVTNGPTIADATSYWVSQVHCNEGDGLKFVIAADGTARFNRDAAPVSWTRNAPDGMMFNGLDGGAVFFSQLKNIYGSIADGSFNGVLLDVSGGHAGCGFGLVGGKM